MVSYVFKGIRYIVSDSKRTSICCETDTAKCGFISDCGAKPFWMRCKIGEVFLISPDQSNIDGDGIECPDCQNKGFNVVPKRSSSGELEPEQEQCEFCNMNPFSVFNIKNTKD